MAKMKPARKRDGASNRRMTTAATTTTKAGKVTKSKNGIANRHRPNRKIARKKPINSGKQFSNVKSAKFKAKFEANKAKRNNDSIDDEPDDDDYDDSDENEMLPSKSNGKSSVVSAQKNNLKIKAKKESKSIDDDDDDNDDDDASGNDSDDSDSDEEMTGPSKDTMERLKEKDPEFYNYLQQNDKDLLDFGDDEEDDEADDDILNENDDDAEDFPTENDQVKKSISNEMLTLGSVKQWRNVLRSVECSKAQQLSAIKSMIRAFRETVTQTTQIDDDGEHVGKSSRNRVSMLNPAIFNAIINAILTDLIPALLRFLRLQNVLNRGAKSTSNTENNDDDDDDDDEIENDIKTGEKNDKLTEKTPTTSGFYDPRRSRNWKRIQSSIKSYLTDVLKMAAALSVSARASFERHILELTPFYGVFPHLVKRLIRRSIDEWCGGGGGTSERNSVLAYLVLHRTIRVIQSNDHLTGAERRSMVNQILRKLYLSYVAVARRTNESTCAQIAFMRNSLAELYRLDDQLAYQHAFIFVRQLAINLRSSFILKEKNSMKTVYNWQFVHSILLWTQLICSAHSQTDVLDPLISPLVMIITGTIKLLPTIKFLPLRFHLIRALMKLNAETDQFIPVLRYFLEIYSLFDPNKAQQIKPSKKNKNKKNAKQNGKPKSDGDDDAADDDSNENGSGKSKPINFEVMLKIGKERTNEIEFVQKVFEKFYTLCLQYATSQAASIAFPEMVTIFLHQTRKFISNIRTPKERTLMKQLTDKMQENLNFIIQKRKSVRFAVNDTAKIIAWERELRQSESAPLAKFYKQFKSSKDSTAAATSNKRINEDSMDRNVQDRIVAESKRHTFNVESDLIRSTDRAKTEHVEDGDEEEDEEEEDEELNDEELAELGELDDDDDDLDEEIEFGDDDDDGDGVELTAEQFAKIKAKIEKEEQKFKANNKQKQKTTKKKKTNDNKKRQRDDNNDDDDDDDIDEGEDEEEAKKKEKANVDKTATNSKRKSRKQKKKKPRRLNNNLQLEGAFVLSSDDDDN